jgi:tRNA 2-thiouridine synthesizing protein A
MERHELDTRGLRCPQPILTLITYMPQTSPGDLLTITADCEAFEEDVRGLCTRMGKTLLAIRRDGDEVSADIQL